MSDSSDVKPEARIAMGSSIISWGSSLDAVLDQVSHVREVDFAAISSKYKPEVWHEYRTIICNHLAGRRVADGYLCSSL